MFTKGQIIFSILFILAFAIVIWFAYKGDRRLHAKNYRGVKWIAVTFLLFVVALFCLKYWLK